ncbi:MAG: Flp pilus assembly protein CpaB [Methylocella sp.]
MKIGTLLVLLAAILTGAAAAYFAREIIMKRPSGPHATLVVAAQPLAFGTELTADNTIEVPWTASAVPFGFFASKDALFKAGKRVALSPMQTNEPILASLVTGPNQKGGLSAFIDPGMRAVAIPVNDVRGVAGFVTPGDRVDVLLTRKETRGEASTSYADVLLQDVKVLGVDQIANPSQEKAAVAKAVTVEVTTEEAEKLVLAEGVGTLSLVLRKAGAAGPEVTRRVTSLDLGQGEYQGEYVEAGTKPTAAPPLTAAPAPAPQSATVRVFRGVKPQIYNVERQL